MTPFSFFPPRQFDIDLFREANPHLVVTWRTVKGIARVCCHAKKATQ